MCLCEGITCKGGKCKNNAIQGQDFCNVHRLQTLSECGICLETINKRSPSVCKSLTCKHLFCNKCINKWIIEKYQSINCSCPMCRTLITRDTVIHSSFQWGYDNNYIYNFHTNVYPLNCLDYYEIQIFKKVAAHVYNSTGATVKENTFRIFCIIAETFDPESKPVFEKMKINSYSNEYYEKTIDGVEKQKSYDMIFKY